MVHFRGKMSAASYSGYRTQQHRLIYLARRRQHNQKMLKQKPREVAAPAQLKKSRREAEQAGAEAEESQAEAELESLARSQ